MKKFVTSFWELLLVISVIILTLPIFAHAASSTNYEIQEDTFTSGGTVQSSSPNYTERDASGSVGVGNGRGNAYQAQSGYVTTNDPTLSFIVNTTSVPLGSLSTSSTGTGTATFSVKDYVSSGYIVTIAGNTPTSGGHSLTNLATPTASSAGTEQFGINLVANTSPTTFGANPVQIPTNSFSFGAAATNYNTPNLYKYVSGDTIAHSVEQTGQTDYTISFIANIAALTPGGTYTTDLNLVVVGTY